MTVQSNADMDNVIHNTLDVVEPTGDSMMMDETLDDESTILDGVPDPEMMKETMVSSSFSL
jgi:hypothetical protein